MALDPAIQALDRRFYKLVHHNAHIDHLWTGARWTEGPVYLPASRQLLFSDIPNDRTLRYDELTDSVTDFEKPAFNANGHCRDLEGRVVTCEHRGRAVSRIGHDGLREILADSFEGKRLNSPNDAVVKSDGSVWFTDPTYGIDSNYEGDRAESELGESNVYRIDVDGSVAAVITDMVRPNGLAFSPDESILYVADTGMSHVGRECPPDIRAYPMTQGGVEVEGTHSTFATCDNGAFDGFRVDTAGNVWSSAADGVHCFDPDGTLIGKIAIPEVVANVEFGGLKRNRLYICGTTSLYAMYINAHGAV
jgi:gluconolactonase